jgi:hypothetical protein
MELKDMINKVICDGGESFRRARDKAHAHSMRVSAFNIRRGMPENLANSIGIQVHDEDGKFFLRIFDRKLDGAEYWERDKETGKLVPVIQENTNPEETRMRELMLKAGKTEEEIKEALGE